METSSRDVSNAEWPIEFFQAQSLPPRLAVVLLLEQVGVKVIDPEAQERVSLGSDEPPTVILLETKETGCLELLTGPSTEAVPVWRGIGSVKRCRAQWPLAESAGYYELKKATSLQLMVLVQNCSVIQRAICSLAAFISATFSSSGFSCSSNRPYRRARLRW